MNDQEVAEERGVSEEIITRIRLELGNHIDSIHAMPEYVFQRVLQKLAEPERALERVRHARGAELSDDGDIPADGVSRALAEVASMRATAPAGVTQVAGVPTGGAVLPVDAREAVPPEAGLVAGRAGWTELGPGNIGGRTRALLLDSFDTTRMFAAGVAGGVWRSTDAGASWQPTDDLIGSLAVCSLVMDPTDSDTLYAGTGEGFSNIDAVRGDGILRTTDGGTTWQAVVPTSGNPDFHYVNSLAISSDGSIILAGTMTGIFRSSDSAHSTWTQVSAGAYSNVTFDPDDDSKAVAGLLTGDAQFSVDGGVTWATASTPSATGRVQLCYAVADTSVVYASVEETRFNRDSISRIWRSTDGGQSYETRNAQSGGATANYLGGQGWYDNVIWAGDPTDKNMIVVGGIDLWKSMDAGDNLEPISTWWDSPHSAHADHHAIVSDPGYNGTSNKRVYFGNDGGLYMTDDVSTVGNDTNAPFSSGWQNLNNGYAVTQFYYGTGDITTNTIVGGTQDNGSLRYTPGGGMTWGTWYGGDGGAVGSDRTNSQIYYGEYTNLNVFRNTNGAASSAATEFISGLYWDGTRWVYKPVPFQISDARDGTAPFIAPFVLDPNDSDRLIGGGRSVWRTEDPRTANNDIAGPTWTAIKPDIGSAVSALCVALGDSDVLAVGHENGNVYITNDGTATSPSWTQIDTTGIGANRRCLGLAINPDDYDIIYATFGGYNTGNVWKTTDGGASWTDISTGLPEAPVRAVSLHPQRSSWVYIATEVGVFASEDGGANWSLTNEGPANVSCHDLFWMRSELVVATHGRGMFSAALGIANAFPNPQLVLTGTEDYTTPHGDFTRYIMSVTNRTEYPRSLWAKYPDLPPCGLNEKSSRTWVDIHNGANDQRIYGYCALSSSDGLDGIWFAVPRGTVPPDTVYIVIRDRLCSANYTSNSVSVPS